MKLLSSCQPEQRPDKRTNQTSYPFLKLLGQARLKINATSHSWLRRRDCQTSRPTTTERQNSEVMKSLPFFLLVAALVVVGAKPSLDLDDLKRLLDFERNEGSVPCHPQYEACFLYMTDPLEFFTDTEICHY